MEVDGQANIAPPSLIAALRAGFDSIANHISLILFPLLLDLFLWIGPRMKLQTLVEGLLREMSITPGMQTSEAAQGIQFTRELWMFVAERLNLFTAMRSFPVGVPSLMAGRQPVETPVGIPPAWYLDSFGSVIGLWLVVVLAGICLGTIFYEGVAQVSLKGVIDWRDALGQWGQSLKEVLLLTLFLVGLLSAIALPGSCLVSLVSLANFSLGQFGALIFGGLLVWVMFPLFFSAHGIFVYRQRMWISLKGGVSMTRMTFIKTGMLFIFIILISEGLNTLWVVPPENSWFSFIGLAGHAFVSTSLLAASFIYYRDATCWVQRLVQQAAFSERKNLSSPLS